MYIVKNVFWIPAGLKQMIHFTILFSLFYPGGRIVHRKLDIMQHNTALERDPKAGIFYLLVPSVFSKILKSNSQEARVGYGIFRNKHLFPYACVV